MAIAPIAVESHLVEILRPLVQGAQLRPLDIFELALNTAPSVLVALKLRRHWRAPRP